MKRIVLAMIVALLASAAAVMAQAPAGPPKPGPEVQKLSYYVGKWKGEGEMKPSDGPAVKITYTETCEWFAGGFHVLCHLTMQVPVGEIKGLSILGYTPEEKVYTLYAINSVGLAGPSKGKVDGDTWSWTGESRMGGKPLKSQGTIKPLAGGGDSVRFEMAVEGGPSMVMEAKRFRAE